MNRAPRCCSRSARASSSPTTSPSSPSTAWSACAWRRTPWMATLPVTAYVAGGALFAGLVGRHQRAWGRRRAFQLGLVVAIGYDRAVRLGGRAAAASGCWSPARLLAGYYNANAGLYRFAATETGRAGVQGAGDLLGAGRRHPRRGRRAEPGPVDPRRAAGRVRRRLCRARRASPWRRWSTMSFIRFPPLARPTPRRPAAAARDRRASRCSSSPSVACALRLRRDEPADGGDADRHGDVLAPVRRTPRSCSNGTCSACSCRASSPAA